MREAKGIMQMSEFRRSIVNVVMSSRILLVDDEPNVIQSLKRALMDEPYEVHTAVSGEASIQLLRANRYKVIISDERMPGMTGDELLRLVKEHYPEAVRIMLTGHASLEAAMKAVNNGEIYRFFTKPWNELELILSIRSAIEKYDLEAENRRLLKAVKNQSLELKILEKKHPGISRIERDEAGNLVLEDISGNELDALIAQSEKEGGG